MGAFEDLVQADLEFIASGEFGEGIEYQAHGDAGPLAWKALRAVIRTGDPSNPLDMGTTSRRGPDPLRVRISKGSVNGIAEVHERRDRIKRFPATPLEKLYTVQATIDTDDPGEWVLYAIA